MTATKKISAAAIAAVLAIGSNAAMAAPIVVYSTGFEPAVSPTNPVTYTTGNLVGQNGWQAFPGQNASVTATVQTATVSTGVQAVNVFANGQQGFFDFYNPQVTPLGTQVTPAVLAANNGKVSISFDLNRSQLGGAGASQFYGIDILNGTRTDVIAGLYLGLSSDPTPVPEVAVANNSNVPNFSAGSPTKGGVGWDTYTANLDFNTNTYTVSEGGVQLGGTYALNAGATPSGGVGAVAFADISSLAPASDHGYFDNLVVSVPEPASLGMVGVGTLALLSQRRKRMA